MKSFHFKNPIIFTFCFLCFSISLSGQATLTQEWETSTDLKEPESVIYDAENELLYVSNINNPSGGKDGNGSIGKVALDGEILEVEWVYGGMDAPKGLGLVNNLLYVADPKKVVVIDTETGKIHKTIEIANAGMLNDITVDNDGSVYVSDSQGAKIYRIQNDKAEVWLENDVLKKPNGLLAHEGKLYMVDMGSEIFYEILKDSKDLRKIAEGLKGGDGIVPFNDDFIISNWNGEVYHVTPQGDLTKLLDTKAEKVNAADIAYLPQQKLLLVPTFFANKLVAYKVK